MTPPMASPIVASSNGRSRPLVAISMGDPCGIGAEVIVKALDDPEVRTAGRIAIFGFADCLDDAARLAGIKPFWFRVAPGEPLRVDSGVVVVDFPCATPMDWTWPRPTAAGGLASLKFFDAAIDAAKSGEAQAIVTGPIHKSSWQAAGCSFPGHTEKLAAAFSCRRYAMMFDAPGLRVALASTHVGLLELRNHFNIGLVFQPIDLLSEALRNWFGIESPRIGVAGLNPHAGEGGLFGDEENRVIAPAIQMARNIGIDAEGPLPADTLFTPKVRSRFDGIVAMYHDQGLIPVKLLAFDRAVNVTLGVPVVRTSVDHGTAFDIARKNLADPGSMKAAIRLACRLATNRTALLAPATSLPVGA